MTAMLHEHDAPPRRGVRERGGHSRLSGCSRGRRGRNRAEMLSAAAALSCACTPPGTQEWRPPAAAVVVASNFEAVIGCGELASRNTTRTGVQRGRVRSRVFVLRLRVD